uniref:Coatomer subunit zeta n=1 Tax=Mus spicilegus TaxID=10103 RepID=A0A8C6N4T0_MUSSI
MNTELQARWRHSLYTVKATLILDNDGDTLFAKYYDDIYPRTHWMDSEITLLEGMPVIYKSSINLYFCAIVCFYESELMLMAVLNCLFNSLSQMLRKVSFAGDHGEALLSFLYKIISEIKCYIKWELYKDVNIKFKAVFHHNILIKSSKQQFFTWPCLIIVHTCDFILGPKCFFLNTKSSQVYYLSSVIVKIYCISYYAGFTYYSGEWAHSIFYSNFITYF